MKKLCKHKWVKLEGLYSLNKVQKDKKGKFTFFPTVGMIVKTKLCVRCNELKMFVQKKYLKEIKE